jgi:hypothetical protein
LRQNPEKEFPAVKNIGKGPDHLLDTGSAASGLENAASDRSTFLTP